LAKKTFLTVPGGGGERVVGENVGRGTHNASGNGVRKKKGQWNLEGTFH